MPAKVLVSSDTTALQILWLVQALLTFYIAKADVEKFMNDTGVSVDKEMLDNLFKALEKTPVADAIAAGSKKVAAMPSGGAARPAAAAGGDAGADAAPKEDEKKEEEEKVDMGDLFGGGDDYY